MWDINFKIVVFLFISLVIYRFGCLGQTNITRNHGIEAGTGCNEELNKKFNANTQYADHWANPRSFGGGRGTSDVTCSGYKNVNAFNGNRMLQIHINPTHEDGYWKEFAVNELDGSGIEWSHSYLIRMRIHFTGANYNFMALGALFSQNHPRQKKINKGGYLYDYGSSIFVSLGGAKVKSTNIGGYVEVEVGFTSNSVFNLQHMTLGEYFPFETDDFFIDDVELFDLGILEECPQTLLIQDVSHSIELKEASQKLRAGYNVGAQYPTNVGDVTINSNGNVIYKAGEEVNLEPGFETEYGANFLAYIAPCSSNPCPGVTSLAPAEYSFCDLNAHTISTGFTPQFQHSIKWTPSTYLSADNVQNPVFTPPNNQNTQVYQVEYKDPCGNTASQQVSVSWTNTGVAPVISMSNLINSEYQLSFDLAMQATSEWLEIDVKRKSDGVIVFSTGREFAGSDYSAAGTKSVNIPCGLTSVCHDYEVIIRTKNTCSSDIASSTIDWNRSGFCNPKPQITTALPNAFTPNGDNIYDEYCINVCGAEEFEIDVFNNWGFNIFQKTGNVCSTHPCLWDGTENQLNTGPAVVGQYIVVIKIKGCGNETSQTAQSVTLLR